MSFPSYTTVMHSDAYPAISPSNPALSAKGKVIVVTGGGSGVGKEISRAFVQAGAKAVAILGRREALLSEAKKSLEAEGNTRILSYVADVVDGKALSEAFEDIAAQAGPIDVTVANAGYLSGPANAVDTDLGDWWKCFEINIKGTLLTFQSFMKYRSTNKPVFISMNTAGAHYAPFEGLSAYGSSKAGLAALIPYLQKENPDVRVVSQHPGVIMSEMYTKSNISLEADSAALPAAFAVWLASSEADWTGGRFLWSHWDVEELKQWKDKIIEADDLTLRLQGWPNGYKESN